MLKGAKLPPHCTPHGLRHTFASLLLQQGLAPVASVQSEDGHASIQLTIEPYETWLPMRNKAAVDALGSLDDSKVASVSKVAASNDLRDHRRRA